MNENTPLPSSRRLHPLIATAAVVLIIACVVAVAAITGLLPTSKGANQSAQPADISQTSPAASPAIAAATPDSTAAGNGYREAPQPVPSVPSQFAGQTSSVSAPVSQTPAPAPVCERCGRVESIRQVVHQGQTNGVGVAAGAILGGILGHQVGSGRGQTVATLAGAVGGGYAGNEVEKNRRQTVGYQVIVHMDDGHTRYFTESNPDNWRVGERVHDAGGHLEHAG